MSNHVPTTYATAGLFTRFLTTLLVLVAPMHLLSIASADNGFAPSHVSFERFGINEGLTHGAVRCIALDSTGFLWIGTEDGLNRYDGTTFTHFHHSFTDSTGLPSSFIFSLTVDRTGQLWIGTGAGLAYYDRRTGRCVRVASGPPHWHTTKTIGSFAQLVAPFLAFPVVQSVLRDKRGTLWVASKHGISRLDTMTRQWYSQYSRTGYEQNKANYQAITLGEDLQGNVWAGCHRGWLLLLDSTHKMPTMLDALCLATSDEYNYFERIRTDSNGYLWCCVGYQLVCVNPITRSVIARYRFGTTGKTPVYDIAPAVQAVQSTDAGRRAIYRANRPDALYWVATAEGVFLLDARSGTTVQYTHHPANARSLIGNICSTILCDRSGIVWVGNTSHGISKYAPYKEKFRLYRHDPLDSNTLSDNYIRQIWQDTKGQIWVCTQYGGLNLLQRSAHGVAVKRLRYQNELPHSPTDGVYQDCTGQRWVGLYQEEALQIDSVGRWKRFRPAIPIVGTWTCPDGSFWAVGYSYLCKVTPRPNAHNSGSQSTYTQESQRLSRKISTPKYDVRYIPINEINVETVCEDKQGMVWIGGENGLVRINPHTGEALRIQSLAEPSRRLLSGFATMITLDSKGNLWVATKGGGIARYDYHSGTFTPLTTEHGLPHNNCYAILEDSRHRLWISTDKGLACYDETATTIQTFDISDGLQGWEFNRRAYHKAPTGEMFFGGVNGLNSFFPDSIATNPVRPRIAITALHAALPKLDSVIAQQTPIQGIWNNATVELAWQNNTLRFSFLALEFTKPDKNQYQWRLEGFDHDWTHPSTRHEAQYSNLAPGTYIFRVRASNGDGLWSEREVQMSIIIHPAWWQRWQTHLFTIALVAACVWGVYRWRIRLVERRAERLEALVEERTQALQRTSEELTRSQVEIAVLREIDEERQRISRDIHDDVGAHLTNIALWSELAARLLEQQTSGNVPAERYAYYVNNIAQASQSVVQNLSSIIWALHPQNNSLESLFAYLREHIQQLVDDRADSLYSKSGKATKDSSVSTGGCAAPLQCYQVYPCPTPTIHLPARLLRNVYLVVKEAVNNALKHAQATEMTVIASVEHNTEAEHGAAYILVMRICDNGCGFDAEHQRHAGNGLNNMQQRIHGLGGSYTLQTQPGAGTTIVFTVPLP